MNNLTMLYVEDDIDVLQDTLFLLGDYFKTSYTAQDGKTALKLFNERKPDIILLDINLPLMNGLDVAREIRATDSDIPIIMISAYSDKDKLLDAINIGVSSYIVKPFKIAEIKETIEKLIEKQSENQEKFLDVEFLWKSRTEKLFYKKEEISLTKNEILLMKLLCENKQIFFTPHELALEMFSDSKKSDDSNNATQLISRFKKKVLKSTDTKEFFIENVYGAGYRIKIKMIATEEG